MSRIHLSVDSHAESVYPRQRAATVTVRTRSGQVLCEHAPTRKGDPDNPLSDDAKTKQIEELKSYGTRVHLTYP